jgi:hypothetical protein
MMKPHTLAQALCDYSAHQGWLYIQDQEPALSSLVFFNSASLSQSPEEERVLRTSFLSEGWRSTLAADDIDEVISNLEDQLEKEPTLEQRLNAFLFFLKHDAFVDLTESF